MFLAKLIITLVSVASTEPIPEVPFTEKYEKAVDIVAGRMADSMPADVVLKVFSGFQKEALKKGKIKIEKSWKGKEGGEVQFYYADPKFMSEDVKKTSKTTYDLRNGGVAVFFIREESGKKFAAYRYGLAVEQDWKNLRRRNLYKALEALKSGKSMAEASRIADDLINLLKE